MSTHTPTPWEIRDEPESPVITIVDGKGRIICDVMGEDVKPWKVVEANAAFIVRAVNSFDALVAACEAALPGLEQAEAELGGTGYFASKVSALSRDVLKAALALARKND